MLVSYPLGDLPLTLKRETISSDSLHKELAHWHDEIELIHVRTGSIHCHVNDSDFLLTAGELCFINLEELHHVYCTDEQTAEVDVLTLRPDILAVHPSVYENYILPIIRDEAFAHIRLTAKNSTAKLVSQFLSELQGLSLSKPAGYELDVLGILHMIFRRLYILHRDGKSASACDTDLSLQRKMNRFIYEHYAEHIDLDDIARAAGVSRSKCSSLFHKYSQKSPVAFLNAYRLEMSSKLLKTTRKSIADIAFSCGFGQQSYFNRVFLREFGETPMSHRNTACAGSLKTKDVPRGIQSAVK